MEFSKMKKIQFLDHTPLHIVKHWMDFLKKQDIGITSRHQLLAYFLETNKTNNIVPAVMENRFISAKMPFFNVYPKVAEALAKTKLTIRPCDIQKSIIHDIPAISIKLAKESKEAIAAKTEWFIISVFDGDPYKIVSTSGFARRFFGCGKPFIAVYFSTQGWSSLSAVPLDSFFEESEFPETDIQSGLKTVCRIALGVMMLAADPDYIKPVLLKADEDKTTPLEERIARARNRGVYGFTIGEDIERSPHFRRPHFAIRWTGNGGEIPKLVPVKGSIVGNKELVTVPTGYEIDVQS